MRHNGGLVRIYNDLFFRLCLYTIARYDYACYVVAAYSSMCVCVYPHHTCREKKPCTNAT